MAGRTRGQCKAHGARAGPGPCWSLSRESGQPDGRLGARAPRRAKASRASHDGARADAHRSATDAGRERGAGPRPRRAGSERLRGQRARRACAGRADVLVRSVLGNVERQRTRWVLAREGLGRSGRTTCAFGPRSLSLRPAGLERPRRGFGAELRCGRVRGSRGPALLWACLCFIVGVP